MNAVAQAGRGMMDVGRREHVRPDTGVHIRVQNRSHNILELCTVVTKNGNSKSVHTVQYFDWPLRNHSRIIHVPLILYVV